MHTKMVSRIWSRCFYKVVSICALDLKLQLNGVALVNWARQKKQQRAKGRSIILLLWSWDSKHPRGGRIGFFFTAVLCYCFVLCWIVILFATKADINVISVWCARNFFPLCVLLRIELNWTAISHCYFCFSHLDGSVFDFNNINLHRVKEHPFSQLVSNYIKRMTFEQHKLRSGIERERKNEASAKHTIIKKHTANIIDGKLVYLSWDTGCNHYYRAL